MHFEIRLFFFKCVLTILCVPDENDGFKSVNNYPIIHTFKTVVSTHIYKLFFIKGLFYLYTLIYVNTLHIFLFLSIP